jgi:hypothetical protein
LASQVDSGQAVGDKYSDYILMLPANGRSDGKVSFGLVTFGEIFGANVKSEIRIRDILVRIQICGSIPLTNGSGSDSGSCSFRQ